MRPSTEATLNVTRRNGTSHTGRSTRCSEYSSRLGQCQNQMPRDAHGITGNLGPQWSTTLGR
jgi:hypothetical protein